MIVMVVLAILFRCCNMLQVCIREARLSVTPAIFTEPKPEPRMVRGKMAAKLRHSALILQLFLQLHEVLLFKELRERFASGT